MRKSFIPAIILAAATLSFMAAEDLPTLSVLYFTNTRALPDDQWMGKGLADMVAGDLGASGAFTLVEREELERVLKEQELGLSGLIDEKAAAKTGALLGAKILVYGSFARMGAAASTGEIRIDAKAVDSSTGKVLATAGASAAESELQRAERIVAATLADALCPGAAAKAAAATASASANAAALKSYYRGLDSMDSGRYADAAAFFGDSLRADPVFAKPGKALEDAYKYLKDFRKQRYRREMNSLAADIADLTKRITAPDFYSFGDAVMNPARFGFKDAAEVSAAYQERPNVMNGDTPVMAVWNLQNLLSELGDKAKEYFEDEAMEARCGDEIIRWSDATEKKWPKDPNLPEVLYQKLLVIRWRADKAATRALCERIMGDYPDYRMMWAVEDTYEAALKD